MRYRYLFFDMDNTLFDFDADEEQALAQLFKDQGVPLSAATKKAYQAFNQSLWRQYEAGTLTREMLLNTRFATFFKEQFNQIVDGPTLSRNYLDKLARGHALMPQAEMLLKVLQADNVKLYVTTNGVANTQYRRLQDAGLSTYFDAVFVSEELGYQKPDPRYFQRVFKQLVGISQAEALIVGDSLTSDVQGGQNVGVSTAWYNPNHQVNRMTDVQPTHEIEHLMDLLAL
ncbi:YjjG family noncanonical pyrimidine nucleotidase [Latilactobacillus fragifolii]|uniref:YjjG family noncanonical pyrimidine nucleotidase n=1 Tax=Latilactobacillus fragifolii TaxID=2814244 RepID=UPI001ABA44C4|nr:YjjG family noncanonical pyrimidine nucleotidase [Latilactobacillus fragifolii]